MSILVQTPSGFALHVKRAKSSLIGGPEAPFPAATTTKEGSRCAVFAPTRAALIHSLLAIWSKGGVPLLLSDAAQLGALGPSAAVKELPTSAIGVDAEVLTFGPDDNLCELFTSGSSGAPRIFEKSARQVFDEALAIRELLTLTPEDIVLTTTAFHHLYGLLFGVLAPWAAGASLIVSPQNEPHNFHPEKVAALVKKYGVTRLVSVPAHLRALLQAPVELPTVRTIVSSAAPLSEGDARKLEEKFDAVVIDVLGSTETGGLATRRASAPPRWTPLPGVRVRVDEDECLRVTSPFLRMRAQEEPFFERARIYEDGTFEYLGRSDSVVKVGGRRVDLHEIEALLANHPGVSDSACLSRTVEGLRGEEVLLVVATKTLQKEQIRVALRGKLDATFLPRKIRIVQALPRDERGKLKRSELLALFEEQAFEELGKRTHPIESEFSVPEDWLRFSGHFEGDPLLPALSQLADIILPAIRTAFGGGALASLRRVKWTRAVRPGAQLSLRLEKKTSGIHFQLLEGQALACSGTVRLHPEGA